MNATHARSGSSEGQERKKVVVDDAVAGFDDESFVVVDGTANFLSDVVVEEEEAGAVEVVAGAILLETNPNAANPSETTESSWSLNKSDF